MALKKMAAKCRACPKRDKCNHKRMEAHGYLLEPSVAQSIASPVCADMAEPMLVKHDYRQVKVAENTTITIDLEEMKRRMEEEFYRGVGLGYLRNG